MVIAKGKRGWGGGRGQRGSMVVEGDCMLGNGGAMQCVEEVLLHCTLEACAVLLTNVTPVTPINSKGRMSDVTGLSRAHLSLDPRDSALWRSNN